MKNHYPNEKFSKAVYTMATSHESIQKRVGNAYIYNISHVKVEEVPEEIQAQFIEVGRKLTCVRGSVDATINQMSTDEAINIAENILYMADIIETNLHEEKKN